MVDAQGLLANKTSMAPFNIWKKMYTIFQTIDLCRP